MNISRRKDAKEIKIGKTLVAWEYPIIDKSIHGTLAKLKGRYPEKGRVVNDKCTELVYVIKGSGQLIVEGKKIEFEEGDQLLIRPGERYFWDANATIFMPCTPAWYPEQHRATI